MKIELDLPEFEKELNIEITVRRDGEVVYKTASPSPTDGKEKEKKKKSTTTKKEEAGSGNFMNVDF